jgi:surfactin synthase thioesterase subunit
MNRRSPAGFVCGACAPLFRCAAYDRSCNPGCRFSGTCPAAATEFVEVFVNLFSVECVTFAAAELFVLAVALFRVDFAVCTDFRVFAGEALRAAAECFVDVFAVLPFSFDRIAIGLRAFIIAFDRS